MPPPSRSHTSRSGSSSGSCRSRSGSRSAGRIGGGGGWPGFFFFVLSLNRATARLPENKMTVSLVNFNCFYFQKQLRVPNKNWSHTIQMINDKPVYILQLVNCNAYWPVIGNFYCMPSFLLCTIRYFLFSCIAIFSKHSYFVMEEAKQHF